MNDSLTRDDMKVKTPFDNLTPETQKVLLKVLNNTAGNPMVITYHNFHDIQSTSPGKDWIMVPHKTRGNYQVVVKRIKSGYIAYWM